MKSILSLPHFASSGKRFLAARKSSGPRGAALIFLAAFGIFLPTAAQAEGFRNPPPGTFNLGRAGGRIAQVDDSSAVTQNPANLMDVKGPEFQFTPSVVYMSIDFDSASGGSAHTKHPWKLLPNMFASVPLVQDKITFGLGITVPYGLANEWDESPSSALHYAAPVLAGLKTINVNPSVAAKLGDRVQLGVGLDVMWSELTLKQFYPWFLFGGPSDGLAELKGDGFGYGGNVGATFLVTEHQRLAVTYRSPITVDYDGNFTINNIPPAGAGVGATARSDFGTQIRFPTIVAVGYGIELTDTVRVETDFEWLQFSRFKTLDLNIGNNAVLFGGPAGTSFPEHWKNTFTAGIGGDWKFAPAWVLRAGFQYYETPVPSSTFTPAIPDADQKVFTVGLGYKYKKHSIEFAYGLDFYGNGLDLSGKRRITNDQNPAYNGTYDINVHLISFAYHYSF